MVLLKFFGLSNLVFQKKPADCVAGILYALKAHFRHAEYNMIPLTSCQAFFLHDFIDTLSAKESASLTDTFLYNKNGV